MELAKPKSWLERLAEAHDELAARAANGRDPWKIRLERLRGKIDDADGLERITTQSVFDILELPQRSRTTGAGRRLRSVMTELGWTAVQLRGRALTSGRDCARGYYRAPGTARSTPLNR
jgi:hypothetical protein